MRSRRTLDTGELTAAAAAQRAERSPESGRSSRSHTVPSDPATITGDHHGAIVVAFELVALAWIPLALFQTSFVKSLAYVSVAGVVIRRRRGLGAGA